MSTKKINPKDDFNIWVEIISALLALGTCMMIGLIICTIYYVWKL